MQSDGLQFTALLSLQTYRNTVKLKKQGASDEKHGMAERQDNEVNETLTFTAFVSCSQFFSHALVYRFRSRANKQTRRKTY